ncbi:MAG: sigma-70 family RNA polymerase sigma factor [Chitinophagaceae bacterium]|nr:sigma-70 family RNA polymerase sigma factor [Chitinophagaceae bacterium]
MEVRKNLSDKELVGRLQSGSQINETVKAIYRNYFESLSWYVMNNNGSRQDAEDVFQEVVVNFIDLVQKDKFRGESTIKTFLFSLNRHIWLNELKKRGRALAREEKYEKGQEKAEMDAGHFIAGREAREQVVNLVGQLGDTCRRILVMFYYNNSSMKEILESLNYENEQVVRNKKYKCLKQLEQMIAANPGLKQTLKNLLHE